MYQLMLTPRVLTPGPGRALGTAIVASLVLTGGIARSEDGPPTKHQNGPVAVGHGIKPGATAVAPPIAGIPKNLREGMAQLLEGSGLFSQALTTVYPRLVDAKLAGPVPYKPANGSVETVYCATASLDDLVPWKVAAWLRVEPGTSPGSALIRAGSGTSYGCGASDLDYGPFPELEAARQKKRQARGKTD